MSARNIPVSPDRLRKAEQLFEDGASQREVTRTTGIGRGQLRKYFPGQGWTFKEGGDFRALVKAADVKLGRAA